jgi:hypothetical protein
MKISSKLVGAGLAAMGAMSLSAITPAAAGSISQPGELVGYTWAPLPEGIYFATTESYGNNRGLAYDSEDAISIPVIIWSTPWTLFGGRVEAYVAAPSRSITAPHATGPGTATVHAAGVALDGLWVGEGWDLGNGWGVSNFVGGYAPTNGLGGAVDFWTFNERLGVTWAQNGWSFTGHVIYGVTGNNLSSSAGGVWGTPGGYGTKTSPNYVNLDLTGTYTYGKWTLGAIAFGSWDVSGVSTPFGALPVAKQSQFAVGPFVGYNFGPVILQAWVSRDIATSNYFNSVPAPFTSKMYETRGWLRVIVPLWTAPAPAAPVVAKY